MPPDPELERATLAKVARRLVPLMFGLYIANILARTNINVAVLTMKGDLGLSDAAYGLGAGIFFVGYFFFQVPANVMLERIGARRWIAGIVMAWGVVAACMLFIRDPLSLYALRFLLGVAQAGFFPGMVLYLTYWFPNATRGRAAARFVLANACAVILSGPLGALLLSLDGRGGLQGWQWLFLVEGLPSVLLGFLVLAFLTDRPETAGWLQPEQREWLIGRLAAEREHQQRHHNLTLLQAFAYPRVLQLAALFFLNQVAGSGLGMFANLLLKRRSPWSDQEILWLGTIAPVLGAVALMAAAGQSDRTGERRLFVAGGLGVAAGGIVLAAATRSPVLTLVALAVVAVGAQIANGPFWALTSGFLTGAAAAGGIAFINSVGNSGSFFGPVMMGYLKDFTRDYETGLFLLAGVMALAATVAFLLPPDPAQQRRVAETADVTAG